MPGKHLVLRGDARQIPLADGSVDLIVTSPPYWAQRSYRDAGGHYDGQIGSEPHPRHWLEAMFEVMKECWRVLAPGGSVFVNLGDKRAGSGGHNNWHTATLQGGKKTLEARSEWQNSAPYCRTRNAPDRYEQAHFGRRKSRQLLPERFAIGCEDGLADPEGIGWIVRQIIVWQKANGLPESVTDRTRDDFEYIYHLTKSERYFAAIDEIREPQTDMRTGNNGGARDLHTEQLSRKWNPSENVYNPLGKLPGSVWRIASEPLRISDWAKEKYNLPDHFAAFPTEIPRRLILGFSPSGICTACSEPRRPVVEKERVKSPVHGEGSITGNRNGGPDERQWDGLPRFNVERSIIGYACRCVDPSATRTSHPPATGPDACAECGAYLSHERYCSKRYVPPIRNAVILDVFGGTGTTALVAETLGRTGISLDLSADYCNLARWRIEESGHGAKAESRTWGERQGTML